MAGADFEGTAAPVTSLKTWWSAFNAYLKVLLEDGKFYWFSKVGATDIKLFAVNNKKKILL